MISQHKKQLAHRALLAATLMFAANFSVWILYAVLGLTLQEQLSLSGMQLGTLLAAPILSGALLRIPVGIWSDKFSPKRILLWQTLLTIPPLALLPLAEHFQHYVWLGLWLGISGTSFTSGIRYINDWFERNQQGSAMGIFGAGNAGAAITLALAPVIIEHFSWQTIGPAYALGLLSMTILFAFIAPASPRQTECKPSAPINLMKLQIWRFGLYYFFVFGSFLSLILWLPQYYVNAYQLDHNSAMAFTLFFAATSSLVRALGGWFADRYGGRAVNWSVFWICLVCLFFLSYPPTTMTIHGIKGDVHLNIEVNLWFFSWLIFIIGLAQGFGRASVYKIIHDHYPNNMGQVGGFVAALGALGGCVLPVAFGLADDIVGIHSASFMILYGLLACCMIAMYFANKADRQQKRLQQALEHNFLEMD